MRSQTFGSLGLDLGAGIGLGKGVQITASVPLELKRFTLAHTLPDGASYTPPYELLTPDDELLFGLGDARVAVQVAGPVQGRPLMLSAGLGVMLPTGRTGTNPFTEAVATQRQFRQFGNGTFDPVAELALVVVTRPVGVLVSGSTRVPLYANRKGYRGQLQLSGSAGVVVSGPRAVEPLRLLLLLEASHAGAARWDGTRAENSGRDGLGVRLGFEWSMTPLVVLRGSLLARPLETWQGEQFALPLSANLGISGIVHLGRKKE